MAGEFDAARDKHRQQLQNEFRLAQQAGGVKGGQKYIAGNVREIAGAGGQYQQPGQRPTDPRLGGNMLGGYGSPGVTGAKGGGGGYIGMGNPQQIAAMLANPQLSQQTYGFVPQVMKGSFSSGGGGGTGASAGMGGKFHSNIQDAQQRLAANPHMSTSERQRLNQSIQTWAQNYQQYTGNPYPGMGGGGGGGAPGGGARGGGGMGQPMGGGQGLAGGGLSQTIQSTLQRLLSGGGGMGGGQAPGRPSQFQRGGGGGVSTQGAFGAPQQPGQQPGQFPTDALEAQQAGQVAQQLRAEEQSIREDFGRRGQAGTPAMEAALRQARDRAASSRSQGLQQLQVSAYGENRAQREDERNALMRALQLALSATGQSQGMQQQQMSNMLNLFGG